MAIQLLIIILGLFILASIPASDSRIILHPEHESPDPDSVVPDTDSLPPKCDCYVVSGPEPGYFTNYKFYDFRSVSPQSPQDDDEQSHAKRNSGTRRDGRRKLKTSTNGGNHPSLNGHLFPAEWNIQRWGRPGNALFPIAINHSIENIFVTQNQASNEAQSSHLVLRSTRFENYTSTAEVQTKSWDFFHCSLRMRLRLYSFAEDGSGAVVPPPGGAVMGIFIYSSDISESDIEILTNDPPNLIHYANQPDWDPATGEMVPGASSEAEIPVPWTEWATHRLDWLPSQSRWFLNDHIIDEKDQSVPESPSVLVLNLWSGGGSWSGAIPVGQSVYLGIEWIQIAYNISKRTLEEGEDTPILPLGHGSRWGDHFEDDEPEDDWDSDDFDKRQVDPGEEPVFEQKDCTVVCRVDNVETFGMPEVISDDETWESE